MDLDNIKKTWQENEVKPVIGEEKIQKMINNEGRSAFNSLLRYEKIGIAGLLICIPLSFLIFQKHLSLQVIYVVSCCIGMGWQIYKYKQLKKVDFAQSSIIEISHQFYKYRKAIVKELIVGIVWLICVFFLYGYLDLVYGSEHFFIQFTMLIIISLIGLFVALALYKYMYWNNIKKLEASIKELEEFEKDDQ